MTEPTDFENELPAPSRRKFLRESGALMGGAIVGGLASGAGHAAIVRAKASIGRTFTLRLTRSNKTWLILYTMAGA